MRVLTLWSWSAFLNGAAEPEALRLLITLGAQVRAVRARLHAKIFIVNDSKALVTSANLTRGGLQDNLECGVYIDGAPVADLLRQFDLDWRRASPITEDQLNQMSSELNKAKATWEDLLVRFRELEEDLSRKVPGPPGVWTRRGQVQDWRADAPSLADE